MGKRSQKQFIEDIRDSIEAILSYTSGMSFEEFSADRKTIDAVLRNLEVIGEAAKNISPELKAKYSSIDWRGMTGMRDKLIYGYFGINFTIVWKTIVDVLPVLLKEIEKIKSSDTL
ncbi:MAG: DUF86 domain-containing protein [Spirochaetota bacterium]